MLANVREPVDHIYFLNKGVGSVIVVTGSGARVEAGLFGSEAYAPAHAVAGVQESPYEVTIQVDAEGFRMTFDSFLELMESNRNFQKIVQRSVAAFMMQLSYTAASNARHEVDERLARWLLMCHDRARSTQLPLTHEFMALMLGVRRASVTTALHVLEGHHFIKAERGLITIQDRAAMEEYASDSYGQSEREYEKMMRNLF